MHDEITKTSRDLHNWSSWLSTCTIQVSPNIAYETLKQETIQYLRLSDAHPNDANIQKLCVSTACFPLNQRKRAAKRLFNASNDRSVAPTFISLAREWDQFSKSVDHKLRPLVKIALGNMLSAQLYVLRGRNITEKTETHSAENTIVVYLQPRYFSIEKDIFTPHWNSSELMKTLLSVIESKGLYVLPLVLPLTNILPEDDFPGFPKIGHHTTGNRTKCLHLKIAYLKEYAYLDNWGFGPFSQCRDQATIESYISKLNSRKVEAFYSQLFSKYCSSRESKFGQPETRLALEKKALNIFFPMQTPNDTVMQAAFINQYRSIEIVLHELEGTENLLIIKRHPYDQSAETTEFLETISANRNCIVSDGNVHDLIQHCEVTFCVNSGVGMEAILHLKPVITVGMCDYNFVTETARNESDLRRLVNNFNPKPDSNKMKAFIYYFFHKHACHVHDHEEISLRVSELLE